MQVELEGDLCHVQQIISGRGLWRCDAMARWWPGGLLRWEVLVAFSWRRSKFVLSLGRRSEVVLKLPLIRRFHIFQWNQRQVQQVVASARAYVAVTANGSLRCWGEADWGGTGPAPKGAARQVVATSCAFAAVLEDEVVAWGDPERGAGEERNSVPWNSCRILQAIATNQNPTLVDNTPRKSRSEAVRWRLRYCQSSAAPRVAVAAAGGQQWSFRRCDGGGAGDHLGSCSTNSC